MAPNAPVDKLADNFKSLVISASGNIPGFLHDDIKRMVEECGAKFMEKGVSECTHLVTTEKSIKRNFKKITLACKEGCQVVNVNWLLESIQKKVPENVKEYLLKHGEEEQDTIKPKTGKRGREDEIEEDDASLKRARKEEKINFAMLADLVDEDFPSPSEQVSVWFDDSGFIWDATLVNMSSNNLESRLMHLQLLFDSKSKKFLIWTSWHCPSVPDSNRLSIYLDLDSAKDCFLTEFKLRTGLHWNDRNSDPQLERWVSLEISPMEVPLLTKDVSELPVKVKNVLENILKRMSLPNYSKMLTNQGRNVALTDKLNQRRLQIGLAVLKKQLQIRNSQSELNMIQSLAEFYQQLVLKPGLGPLSSPSQARKELGTLELLLKLHIASENSKNAGYSSLALNQISQAIGLAKMEPVDETSNEYNGLCEYLHKSSSPYHGHQFQEVIGVFRLERPGDTERFALWERGHKSRSNDRRLLWHGSDWGNFAGILSQGLRGDGIVAPNGNSFRQGVYFADFSTKSLGYCQPVSGEDYLILLCEVELGKSNNIAVRRIGATNHNKWRDAGYIHATLSGIQVPDFHAGKTNTASAALYHSEYIALNPAQIIQRYLFHVTVR